MTNPVDKDSLKLNQPKRTPSHPTKSHVVKTKVDGKEKIIRFGQQGASTAGKPKEGESDRMKAKRASFKARHSANIAKGPASAAYWANKVKWAEGGLTQIKAYAKGGKVDAEVDETKAAFGIYPKQRAKPSSKETKAAAAEAAQFAAEMLIPQTPMDAGLMLIPGGKIARKAGAALIGLDASDAEAGALAKMLKAFHGARKPIEGRYDVSKASEASIMGRGLNVSTDPSYPSQWAMRKGSEAPTVYETMVPIDSIIQLDAKYPADSFDVLRKIRGRNPLPDGEVTGEQVYQSLRGLPQSMIPDVVLKSGYKGAEYPAQDKGRWFSIYDTEGVKDRLGKKFAQGGSVSDYDPFQVDEIMNSIDAPRNYAEGGEVKAPDLEFREDPDSLRLYQHAMKQMAPNQQDSVSNLGLGMRTRTAGGDFSAGLDMNRMTQGQQDQLMKSLAANYNVNLGDVNVNAMMQKPLDAKDVYVGMINGSIPLAEGRAMLGIQGVKTPYGTDVLGYNAGWSGKVGPGQLNANINVPKRGKPSGQVQYQIPFAEGGSVSAYDPDQVDAIANQFM